MAADGRPAGAYPIRPVRPDDLGAVALLCAAHAAFERAPAPPADLADRLRPALFGPRPRLWCLVACAGDGIVGYLTYTLEYATWRAAEFVHLDCLYLADGHRGRGVGAAMLAHVREAARRIGVDEVQWQTPAWNADAVRFYDRSGARGAPKVRYTVRVARPDGTVAG